MNGENHQRGNGGMKGWIEWKETNAMFLRQMVEGAERMSERGKRRPLPFLARLNRLRPSAPVTIDNHKNDCCPTAKSYCWSILSKRDFRSHIPYCFRSALSLLPIFRAFFLFFRRTLSAAIARFSPSYTILVRKAPPVTINLYQSQQRRLSYR